MDSNPSNLPSVFQATHDVAPPPQDAYVTGTITSIQKVSFQAEDLIGKIYGDGPGDYQFDLVDIELDQPFRGNNTARTIIAVTDRGYEIPGHRLRGKMYASDADMKKITLNGMTSYENWYLFMTRDTHPYMDFKTAHMAADDHRTFATGNPHRICMDITGHYYPEHDSYYIAHGYDMDRIHADIETIRNRKVGLIETLAYRFNLGNLLPKPPQPPLTYPKLEFHP